MRRVLGLLSIFWTSLTILWTACRQLKNLLDAVDEDLVAFKINRTKEFEAIGSERAQLEEAIDAALEKFHRLDSSSASIEPIDQPPALLSSCSTSAAQLGSGSNSSSGGPRSEEN
uniref:Uncharacterized protein n=1 Tax=Spongospora subterranea TaxID=70186 RepID=A0A0H5QXJ4_9EUKA|eukprot:CRZ06457.1 hypothetical protein [Spongospora subterranea]